MTLEPSAVFQTLSNSWGSQGSLCLGQDLALQYESSSDSWWILPRKECLAPIAARPPSTCETIFGTSGTSRRTSSTQNNFWLYRGLHCSTRGVVASPGTSVFDVLVIPLIECDEKGVDHLYSAECRKEMTHRVGSEAMLATVMRCFPHENKAMRDNE